MKHPEELVLQSVEKYVALVIDREFWVFVQETRKSPSRSYQGAAVSVDTLDR